MKLDLEGYILLLDRLLERQGLSSKERDAIFNDVNNIELISNSFEKRVHPRIVFKQLDREPVHLMYSSSEVTEAVRGRKILSGKQQSELIKDIPLSKGQKYAVDFLKSIGLHHISTPLQLKRGTLIFLDPKNNTEWQISGTGYLRKRDLNKKSWAGPEWQMIYSHFPPQYEQGGKKFLQDDEYMDMAEKLSEKIRGARARKEITFRKSYVDRLFKLLNDEIKEKLVPLHARSHYNEWEWEVTKEEAAEAVKKLYDKYVK
ncbi:MAG: hypothetical protein GYA51_07985 [Candidatus Methanofastidiosa archaeon]|nr:hypothetical protein [Candidatus Methanofastidiosa archaeon]